MKAEKPTTQRPIRKPEGPLSICSARFRETRQFPLPLPFADSTMGPFKTFGFATLELTDSDGITAEGFIMSSGIDLLECKLLPLLFIHAGRPYREIYEELYWAIRNEGFRGGSATVLGQLDHILHALDARRAQLPLHRYWGSERDWVEVYASGGGVNYTEAELEREMHAFKESGYRTVKMKVGRSRGQAWEEDFRRIAMVRDILGPDIALAVDANQVFTAEDAIAYAGRLKDYGIAWFEEPVHSAALHEISRVCTESPVPISYGESEKSASVFPSLIDAGIGHLQPIIGYQASVEEWFTGYALAEEAGITYSSGGFSHTSCQAPAACGRDVQTEFLIPVMQSCEPYFHRYPRIHNGGFQLDDEPGFSVTFNWEKLMRDALCAREKSWDASSFSGFDPVVL